VPHLEVERSVTETIAAFNAFGATDAQRLINGVFVIRIFDKGPLDRRRRTQLIFSTRIQVIRRRFKISRAELAISADCMSVDALDGGFFEHAVRGAQAASDTFLWINLPNRSSRDAARG
jgi:hypothetical protein